MLVTEYCEGGSLTRNIMRGRVSWWQRGRKVRGACAAQRGVVVHALGACTTTGCAASVLLCCFFLAMMPQGFPPFKVQRRWKESWAVLLTQGQPRKSRQAAVLPRVLRAGGAGCGARPGVPAQQADRAFRPQIHECPVDEVRRGARWPPAARAARLAVVARGPRRALRLLLALGAWPGQGCYS